MKNLCQVLCILAVLVSFTNCQNDSVLEMQQEDTLQNELPFKSSLVAKQNVDTNIKLSKKMTSLANIQSNSIAKNAHDGIYDFTVNTEVVKLIESTQNNTHSYTFPIEREQPTSEFENLVFTYNTNLNNYTASLVKYHFTTAQKQEFLLSGRIIGSSYDVSYEPIYLSLNDVIAKNAMPLPCTTNFTVYHITPDTGETFHHSTNGSVQNACEHEDDEVHGDCDSYTVIEIECPDGGSVAGATHDTGSHNTNNSSNNTTSGGNSNSNNNVSTQQNTNTQNVVTSPTTTMTIEEISSELNSLFNGNDSWEFNDEINAVNGHNFNTTEEIEALLDSELFVPENNENYNDQNGYAHSVINVTINFWANLKIDIIQELRNTSSGQEYRIDTIETDYTGVTFGSEWNQREFNPSHHLSINGNLATIDVKGTIEFSIFFQRIGTVAKDLKHYRFVINIDTGEIVSSEILD